MTRRFRREGASWLKAEISVYSDEFAAEPKLQGIRKDVEDWAKSCNAKASYTNLTVAKDFFAFSLNLMMPNQERGKEITEAAYRDYLCDIIPNRVFDTIDPSYNGDITIFIRVGSHLTAMLRY